MTNDVVAQQDRAELIDLFFKCLKTPPLTDEHREYGMAFNQKLDRYLADSPTVHMRAFAREVSELGTIRYTRAFAEVVQLRRLAS